MILISNPSIYFIQLRKERLGFPIRSHQAIVETKYKHSKVPDSPNILKKYVYFRVEADRQ